MDETTLLGIIEAEESDCDNTQLEEDRERAVDYFYGRATGKLAPLDIPNRSQYVSRDVADTIDWIMPAITKTFLGGDEIVEFSPVSQEDEPAAEQETDYVNYVITRQNSAYEVFSTWFDTALQQKNGYVFASWKVDQDVEEEVYEGLGQEELIMLTQDKEVEIVEATSQPEIDPMTGMPQVDPMTGVPRETYTVKLARKNEKGKVCIENIPPELFKVANRHTAVRLADAPFVGFDSYLTVSKVREMGFDVDDDISDDCGLAEDESWYRDRYNNYGNRSEYDSQDPASRTLRVRYRWLRVDYDGDGIAELRYLMLIGKEILVNDKADFIQIASITPRIIAHDHNGRSVAEVVEDLQELKTSLIRGLIDNVVLANNGRTAVNKNTVDLDDLLVSQPGGIVRVNGSPGPDVMPLTHPMLGAPVMSALEMVDAIKENRTGVTKYNMGTDAGNLNKTATGVSIIHAAANQRIEWIAQTFAETGVKELFLITHALLKKHQDKEAVVKLRNNWVPINPREWITRKDMTISVGMGTTNRQVQMQGLMQIAAVQEKAFAVGIVSPENIYNTTIEMTKALGFKTPDKFFTHPEKMPKKEPVPNPQIEKAKMDFESDERDRQLKENQMQFDQRKQTFELIKDVGEAVTRPMSMGIPFGGNV